MKRELKHDILAEKIWERLPEQDKQLRQVRRSIAQRAADYFAGRGSLAGEPELVNWQELSTKLKLEEQEKQFVELSWQEVRAQKAEEERRLAELEEQARREKRLREGAEEAQKQAEEQAAIAAANALQAKQRTRWAFAAFLVALLFVAGTFVLWRQSQSLAKDLEVQGGELADKVVELQNKETALQQALEKAENATDTAEARQLEAEISENRANLALANALASLLREAKGHVRILNYDAAQKAILDAAGLEVKPQEVAPALMEIAYHRIESHRFEEGRRLAQETARLYGKAWNINIRLAAAKDSLRILRNALKGLAQSRFEELEKRYYPTMVHIQGGQFNMGCDSTVDVNCESDETLHPTEVSDFEIAATETTLWQFSIFCEAEGKDINEFIYAGWGIDGARPVIYISWYETLAYANWLSQQQGKEEVFKLKIPENPNDLWDREGGIDWQDPDSINWDASGYRLPTEAEWEYAAKGGRPEQRYIYSGSDTIDLVGWYSSNSNSRTQPVEEKRPNSLGLYDMSGNVWEWCWDWYGENYFEECLDQGRVENPKGPSSPGKIRVLRGGSGIFDASYARCSDRYVNLGPFYKLVSNGFRLARAVSF